MKKRDLIEATIQVAIDEDLLAARAYAELVGLHRKGGLENAEEESDFTFFLERLSKANYYRDDKNTLFDNEKFTHNGKKLNPRALDFILFDTRVPTEELFEADDKIFNTACEYLAAHQAKLFFGEDDTD